MPTLARIYVDPNTSDTTKDAISVAYEMLNGWGGAIGEILRVSMFATLWVLCTSVLFLKSPKWPSWMGWIGFLVAADLSVNLLVSILDYDVRINLTISVVFLHAILLDVIWFSRLQCLNCFQSQDDREEEQEEIKTTEHQRVRLSRFEIQ